jgi:hypothetical protein
LYVSPISGEQIPSPQYNSALAIVEKNSKNKIEVKKDFFISPLQKCNNYEHNQN